MKEQKEMELLIEEQNKNLLQIVDTDYLTDVFNRKTLFEQLEFKWFNQMKAKKF